MADIIPPSSPAAIDFPDPSEPIQFSAWCRDPRNRKREYSEEDDERLERRNDALRERVYRYLCQNARRDGYWRYDYVERGIDEIARGVVDETTVALLWSESLYGNEDDETWIIFDLRQAIEGAIIDLHDEGRIEWVIRAGWPWIHIPNAARDAGSDQKYEERQRRLDELATMPYREYLESREWQERRAIHLEHARERCQVCNRGYDDGVSLHVHHRTYERRGNERFSDLIVLCADCHRRFHKKGRH